MPPQSRTSWLTFVASGRFLPAPPQIRGGGGDILLVMVREVLMWDETQTRLQKFHCFRTSSNYPCKLTSLKGNHDPSRRTEVKSKKATWPGLLAWLPEAQHVWQSVTSVNKTTLIKPTFVKHSCIYYWNNNSQCPSRFDGTCAPFERCGKNLNKVLTVPTLVPRNGNGTMVGSGGVCVWSQAAGLMLLRNSMNLLSTCFTKKFLQ